MMPPYQPTILIVDDEPLGRATLEALLISQEYQLAFASNGVEALAQAAAHMPDLILLDVMMPGMDGFAVCRHLRADPHLAEVPIVLVTALDDRESRLQGLEAGADDFLSKPFNRAELRARVRTITRLNRYRRLHVERAKFERLFERAPDGIAVVAADRTIRLANPALLRLVGVADLSAVLGATITSFITPIQVDYFATMLDAVLANLVQVPRAELTLIRLDGHPVPVTIDAARCGWDAIPAVQLILRDITAQKQAEARIWRQLQRLGALRAIDIAITTSHHLADTLAVVLDQAILQLQVDAADILVFDPGTQELIYTVGRGLPTSALSQTRWRVGEGVAGRVVQERRRQSVLDLTRADAMRRARLLNREGFTVYHGVPLETKGQVVGVLEVFQRAALPPDPEWLAFLETLAGQAAIAIDNASLFERLQRSNQDLTEAYERTLEGWSRALDLRDKETEGHTQRVTEVTVRLASAMGIDRRTLVHIRRGALLHDIGKMGVPDAILLKPGPLTDEEWVIMRKHPVYAYELLAPITFLKEALDIPYGHHEKWDGTGYPRGLAGEQIPLAARIFAVVDVWDAMRSDRPYRKGRPEAVVRDHLQSLAGTHFDPQVVEVFLRLTAEAVDLDRK